MSQFLVCRDLYQCDSGDLANARKKYSHMPHIIPDENLAGCLRNPWHHLKPPVRLWQAGQALSHLQSSTHRNGTRPANIFEQAHPIYSAVYCTKVSNNIICDFFSWLCCTEKKISHFNGILPLIPIFCAQRLRSSAWQSCLRQCLWWEWPVCCCWCGQCMQPLPTSTSSTLLVGNHRNHCPPAEWPVCCLWAMVAYRRMPCSTTPNTMWCVS